MTLKPAPIKTLRGPRSSQLRNRISRAAALRLERGLTLTQAAALAGVTQPTISRLERGAIRNIQLSTLVRVAVAYNVAPSELVPALTYRPKGLTRKDRTHVVHERTTKAREAAPVEDRTDEG